MRVGQARNKLSRADALQLWHTVNLGSVLDAQPDLTTRQTALLMCVYLEEGPHTVRSLALRLNVTKAVITRALNTLERYDFTNRGPDMRDKRSVLVKRTGLGARYLSGFAERICSEANMSGSVSGSVSNPVSGHVSGRVSSPASRVA